MNDKIFFDTNVFVYAFDSSNAAKHDRSAELIKSAFKNKNGCISTQVLQEFFVVSTRKIAETLTIDESRDIIKDFSVWSVIDITLPVILNAIEVMKNNTLSFWDSLIICAAKVGGCNIIYSEDLSHDQIVDDIRIVNP